jgi:hypothetical protein
MISPNRDILVLLKDEAITEEELDCLLRTLHTIDTPEYFCRSHELVDRYRITSNSSRILKECRGARLREFRFLINKN